MAPGGAAREVGPNTTVRFRTGTVRVRLPPEAQVTSNRSRCCPTLLRMASQAQESRNRTSPFVLQATIGPTEPMPGVEPGILNFASTQPFLREANSITRQSLGRPNASAKVRTESSPLAASIARDETVRTRNLQMSKSDLLKCST